jgi:RimJ/RimL family protein N-acetyltransferase
MTGRLHDTVAWPVRTRRLTLRPATAEDAAATWEFRPTPRGQPLAHPEHWHPHPVPRPVPRLGQFHEDPRRRTRRARHRRPDARVQDACTQTEVADLARSTQGDLGWVLHPDHTGHGYATEAVRELLDIAFNELQLRRVTAACFAANEASWRLMERLGMRRETYNVRESLHRSGEWLDGMVYALLAD